MPSLTWLTRDDDIKRAAAVPYRLLEAEPALSHGDPAASNMLIQGDNLDALKALLPYYKGRVKCIYIDPPYNTRSAFEHYDDNLEHTQWLAMIYPRLELLRDLLAEDGSIWINLDENEAHYLKVMGDGVFGRNNFVRQITWQKKYSVSNNFKGIASLTDIILVWQKSAAFKNNLLPRSAEAEGRYTNPDNDARGPWKAVDYLNQASTKNRPNLVYEILNPITGEVVRNRDKAWKYDPSTHASHVAEKRLWWGLKGENSVPALKLFLSEVRDGMTPHNWWPHTEVGHTDESKKENIALFGREQVFDTPKPERLIARILQLASNPGDLVLDSFLGSGTTAAVAHKMGRRWIGVEMGDHAVTHCAPRLVKVIEGEQGGISKAVNWNGGGGFSFYRLGEEVFDEEGRLRSGIKFQALAAHVWFSETGVPYHGSADSPFLGNHGSRGFALLYNGILGDKSVSGGNVLTANLLTSIRAMAGHNGPLTIYGEASRIGEPRLKAEGVTFKQTPYDVKAR
jgi:adenine-specific DNA-methyltransferase